MTCHVFFETYLIPNSYLTFQEQMLPSLQREDWHGAIGWKAGLRVQRLFQDLPQALSFRGLRRSLCRILRAKYGVVSDTLHCQWWISFHVSFFPRAFRRLRGKFSSAEKRLIRWSDALHSDDENFPFQAALFSSELRHASASWSRFTITQESRDRRGNGMRMVVKKMPSHNFAAAFHDTIAQNLSQF